MGISQEKYLRPSFQYLSYAVKLLLLALIAAIFIFFLNPTQLSRYFPIKTVHIYGAHHTQSDEIKALLQPLKRHGFFTLDIEYIRDRLLQMPWVADIFVKRNWPDEVSITVIERKAMAKWNTQSLLSDAGELFAPEPKTYPADLPQFVGPQGSQMMMLNYFREMNKVLLPLKGKIIYLEVTPYLVWNLKLDNGINLKMGHKDVLTRLTQFVRVYPKIIGARSKDVDYVDLRYPNGMAVRWKPHNLL